MATIRIPFARCAWAGRVILATLFVLLCCASSARAQTVVSLTFDDGIQTQLGAASVIEAHGMRGTFYINSGNIGSKAFYMSWAQLDGLAANGHEIAGHTVDHMRLTDLTPAAQRSEICDDAAALRSRGYSITDFAYPFGAGSTAPGVLQALKDCGYVSARKVGDLSSDSTCGTNCPAAETLPPGSAYAMRATPLGTGPITLAMLEGWVTQAEANGGGLLPIVFHSICDGCEDNSVSAADFSAFVDWLSQRTVIGTVVKPVRQALAEGPQFPPPTTTIACNSSVCGTSTFKSPVSITFARTDSGGGLGATRYTLDGTDPTTSSPQYTAPFTLTQTKTVKFRTWDLSGNPEAVRTQIVNVDGTAPTTSINSPADGSRVLTSGGAITVKVDAADVGSGVSDVQLLVDGDWKGSSTSTSSPYQFTLAAGSLALGNHSLKAIATDVAGNQTTSATTTFTLSDGTPTTTIACGGAACPDTYVKGPLSVSLSATDGGGGVGATRYTLDGTDPTTSSTQYAAPFSVTSTTTVKFRTWNTAGQPEAVKTQLLKVDAVAPTASVTSPTAGASFMAGNLNVQVAASDASAGISDVQLFLDGDFFGSSSSTSSPYQFTIPSSSLPLGTHRVKALAIDVAGNQFTTADTTFTIKDGLPVTSIACNGAACSPDFVKGPVSVTLSAADGGTGVGVTRYTTDGTDPTTSSTQYTGAFTLTTSTTVKFRTWNSSGTPETVKAQVLKIDGVSPTASITTPTEGSSVTTGPVTVKVDATDAGAGMGDVQLLVDGDYAGSAGGTTSPYQFTLGTLSLGQHKLKAIATDAIGNSVTTAQVTFSVKDGLPVTSIACNGSACSTDWVKGPVSVTLSAADGGTGVGVTRYTLDGTDPTTSSTQYTGAFSLATSKTVKFRTWNSSGTPETVKTQVLNIDAVAPTAAITSPADGSNIKGDVTVNVTATDTGGSGISNAELYLDGDWKAFTAVAPYKFTLPANQLSLGTHRIKVIAYDNLGNSTTSAQVTFTLKDGLPETSIACNGAACPTDFVKGPVSVSLSATDGGGGLGATRYTLDGTDPTPSSPQYTAPFTLSSSTTVKFRTWDLTGQPETVKTQALKIDAVAPTASITSPTDGANVQGDVTVNVNATDAGSGISDAELYLDGDWKAYTATAPYKFTLPANQLTLGAHRIKVFAYDNLGNNVATNQVTFNLKDGLPETSIACGGTTCPTDFVKGPVSVSLTAVNGGGGLGATRYTLDGTDPTTSSTQYTAPFTLTDTKTVKFRTWDNTGAAETVKSQLIKIDPVAPTVSITSPTDGANVKGDVTINVAATDAGSGISDAELYLDGDWKAYTATAPYTFTLPANQLTLGAHRIKVFAYDNMGNSAATPQVTFNVKDGLPETSIACNGAACPTDFVKGPVSVSLSATDSGGGLGATRYTLDGTDPTPSSPQYTAPFTLSSSATVKFRTWDLTGQPETTKTQALKIDAVAPTASITSPIDNSNTQGDVAIGVNATDAGSGISDVELYLDGDWKAYTATAPYKFTLPKTDLALGPHRIKAMAYDNLGNNVTTTQVTFNQKDGLPETAIACNAAACPTDWVKGPIQVTLSATNSGTGGLAATRYTLDGTDPDTSSTQYTGPFTLTESKTVKFRTWDNTGAAETVKTQALKIDAVGPTAQITSPADSANVLKSQPLTVKTAAADAGSGVSEVDLQVDGDDLAGSTTSPYDITIPANTLALGQHKLKAVVIDALGNKTSSALVTVNVKDGLPETAIACNGAACSPDFVKGPVSVSLTATNGGGGLGATRFTLDGTDPTTSSPQYTAPFTLTTSTTVKFRTWDTTGAAETVKTQALKIDAVGPIAQITAPADNANTIKANPLTVKVDATDAGSGISEVDLLVDGDNFAASTSTSTPYDVTIPADALALGQHKLKVVAVDVLGNKTSTAVTTINVKDSLPETSIACGGTTCPADFVKGPVSVSLSATDGGGGLGATRYTLDGTDPDTSSPIYTGPFTLTDTKTVKFRTWDSTGAAETVKSQTIKIDAVAPTATISSPADNSNLQKAQPLTVKVDASDAGSGVSDVSLLVDGDNFASSTTASSPYDITIPADALALGAHKLKAIVTDALGNKASSAITSINVKNGLPETAIACDGGICPTNWVKGPVSVSLSPTDGGGGLGATRYTLDGSDPDTSSQQYTGPFTLTDTKTVKFRTWDTTGAAEPVKSQTIKVDSVAPTAQITSPTEGANVVGDVNVKANASDAGAGLSDVELFLDGDFAAVSSSHASPYGFTIAAGTIPLGTHRVKIVATDTLGNRASSDTVTFTLTNGLPTTTIACDGGACPTDFVKGPVSVSLSAADGGNGLGATRYTLDGTDPDTSSPQYSGPLTLTDTKAVKFRTWDSAGNAEQVRSQTIKVDAVAPTAAITTPTDGSDQVGAVGVKVDASDAGSGVGDVQLFVDGDYKATSTSTASPYAFTLPAGSLSFGTHKLKALVTDKLGNSTSSTPVTITVKDGVPMTTIACDGGTCPTNFVTGPVSVTLAAIDGGSGVAATRYTLDGTDPDSSSQLYTGPLTVSATTTVKFRSWSSAGDVEPVHTQTINIDTSAPTAQISSPAEGAQVEGDVSVKVDATDAGAGIGDVSLFVDGDYVGFSQSTSSPYEITWHAGGFAPGPHKIKAVVADRLDHRTTTDIVNVTIKTPPPPPGPPTTTISCDGLSCPTGFVKNPVSVTLAAIDGGTGVGPTRYTLDGTDPTETSTQYSGPFTVSQTTTVKFRTWGSDGVPEQVRSQTIKLDSTPPTATITSPTEGESITGDMVVKADVADAGAGVSNVDLYVDGDYVGFSHSTSSPYEITLPAGTLAPGTHKLKIEATDKLGNSFRTDAVTINVAG